MHSGANYVRLSSGQTQRTRFSAFNQMPHYTTFGYNFQLKGNKGSSIILHRFLDILSSLRVLVIAISNCRSFRWMIVVRLVLTQLDPVLADVPVVVDYDAVEI